MDYPKHRYTGPQPWLEKDWLYNQYITLDKSSRSIADEYGCSQNTIQWWLKRHNIRKKITKHDVKQKHQYQDRDYLYHQHIDLHKSMSEIAKENGVSQDCIRHHMQKNGINVWHIRTQRRIADSLVDQIIHLYCDMKMSTAQIESELGIAHTTIVRHLENRGIELRNMSDAQIVSRGKEVPKELSNKELLEKWHWDEMLSCKDIGERLGVDPGTVRRRMKDLDIRTRTNAESKIGLMVGDKHPNWQGGKSPLKHLLREFFTINQSPKIAARDNYTCQLCGKKHTTLNVHHIIPFTKIVDDICDEHPELDVDKEQDRIELYNIITHDDRFLDENNLITYCKQCHYFRVHKYRQNKTISSQASKEEGSETIPEWSTL